MAMHSNRKWDVADLTDVAARKGCSRGEVLSEYSWTTCCGFRLGDYLFLNDSTGADGAQEYAVAKLNEDGSATQIESITFGWCDAVKANGYVDRIERGDFDAYSYATIRAQQIQTHEQHGTCGACA